MRDLTHPVADGMMVYPGDPAVHLAPALELERDGAAVTALELGSHTGTHVDAPAHTVAGAGEGSTVGVEQLGELPDAVPPIVVVDTGWWRRFGSERALRHPALAADAARELVARGMRVLAVDTLSPDPTDAAGTSSFPVHGIVLGADGLIVENVTNLEGLPDRVRVGFFPLRLAGDGAPVRAVAFDA